MEQKFGVEEFVFVTLCGGVLMGDAAKKKSIYFPLGSL